MHHATPARPRLRTLILVPAAGATALAVLVGCATQQESAASKAAPLELVKPAYKEPWTRYGGWPATDWKGFDNLRSSGLTPKPAGMQKVEGPITGDAEKGKALVADRGRGGSCLVCHVMPGTLPGNVGPDLSEIGNAGRSDEYLYNYIYDARNFNGKTVMPPWGAVGVFKPEEIRDMVAYLKTLKSPAKFKNADDDPAKRPVPVEDRDNLDPTENPGMFELDAGAALYKRAGPGGKSCKDCHADPAKQFKTWAATMPYYEERMKKVLNVEEFITRHARATTGDEFPMQSKENLALAIFIRHQANGAPIRVDVSSPGAREAAARGEALTKKKIGQLNFSCVNCHTTEAGGGAFKWVRGQYLTGQKGQIAHFPLYRTSRGEIWDLRRRYQWCGVAIRANELPPDAPEYGDLELYHASVNQGEKLTVPGIRH